MRCTYVAILVLAACGGDGPGSALDASDTPPDVAVDTPLDPGASLIGSWRQEDADGVATTRVDTYAANGAYSLGGEAGTWRLDGRALLVTIQGEETGGDYYTSPDRTTLLLGVLWPVGAVAGVVGTWHGTYHSFGEIIDNTIEVRTNGDVVFTRIRPSGTDVKNGTWQLNGTTIRLDFFSDIFSVRVIAGVAIGSEQFHRE